MKIPAFIKQLVKFCDSESSRYALGGVKCESDGVTAKLTATDGRIIATVSYPDDHSKKMDAIVDAKQLAAPPAAAFKTVRDGDQPHFDGKRLEYGSTSTSPAIIDGRFPRYEELFTIHDDTSGYVAVRLDPSYLKTLCELAMSVRNEQTKGLTLFVKDAQSCVFGYAHDGDTVARLAIMPLAADDESGHRFPPRPGTEAAAEKPAAESVKKKPKAVGCRTVVNVAARTCHSEDYTPECDDTTVADPCDWSVDLAPI